MSPPPVNTYQRAADLGSRPVPLDLDRNFETTRAYANAVKEVAQAKHVAYADIWTEFWQAAGEQESALDKYLIDGLHPNAEGYKVTKRPFCSITIYLQVLVCVGHIRNIDEDDRRKLS
jgi:tartrate dehydratase alpha subunit/fumarate hydratase class I-like protein